ncbi:hypothetical protein CEXT_482471 [Caerostris extrusa]|uniref:Uncharacterized protein n=1 Tax=Caerostris extrusa TaxID=172846 RepID=A0AAV4NTH8_CAEEX|nr:hypothetical protein CEXT_482471 [Caerostris extrusa]
MAFISQPVKPRVMFSAPQHSERRLRGENTPPQKHWYLRFPDSGVSPIDFFDGFLHVNVWEGFYFSASKAKSDVFAPQHSERRLRGGNRPPQKPWYLRFPSGVSPIDFLMLSCI